MDFVQLPNSFSQQSNPFVQMPNDFNTSHYYYDEY